MQQWFCSLLIVAVDLKRDAWTGDYTAELRVLLFPNSFAPWTKTPCQPLTRKIWQIVLAHVIRSVHSASAFYLDAQRVVWSWFCGIFTSASRGWSVTGVFFTDAFPFLPSDMSILLRFWSNDIMAVVSTSLPMHWFLHHCLSLQHDVVARSFSSQKWLGKCSDNSTQVFCFFFIFI